MDPSLVDQLPPGKGTYLLVLRLERSRRVVVGRLGAFDLKAGYYLYVGSAFGSGGLQARIGRHLDPDKTPRWHIDYLAEVAEVADVWYTPDPVKWEEAWADLCHARGYRTPIPRFGASDYRRTRPAHLFYAKRPPSLQSFQRDVHARVDPHVEVRRLAPGAAG